MSAADLLIIFLKWQIGQGQQYSGSSTVFETVVVGDRNEKLLERSRMRKQGILW